MIYRFIILNGDRHGEQITITREPMIIGRSPSCEIRITDPEIALTHAEVAHTDDGLFIRDLGSMNRLLINHHEVREARPKHGDVVEVGHTRLLIQAYVQAEFQNEAANEAHDEERASRRKSWLLAGGLTLLVIFLIFFIPRCERFFLTPRTPPRGASPTKPLPKSTHQAIKPAIPPPSTTNPPPVTPPAPATNPPPVTEPAIVPPPRPAEPVNVPLPPKEEPAPVLPTSPSTSHPSATSDLLAAAERELHEAALTLKGKISTGLSTNDPTPTPPAPAAEPVKKPSREPDPVAPPAQPAVAPTIVIPEKPTPTPLEVQLPPATNLIKIATAEINKFPETDQFSEMRLLSIRLNALESRKGLDPAAARVEVIFINKDKTTGQLSPASPNPSSASLGAPGVWPASEQRSLVASYVVPATQPPTERTSQFYGFIIGVYYNGVLQDELCQPGDLPAEFGFPTTSRPKPKPAP